mmetsp:Transcript_5660/g.9738  ORF Transcript_5660/g.9738 Transcript_5660/m.9738 type:complete len:244 (-) Transcript_5660:250-981(-)
MQRNSQHFQSFSKMAQSTKSKLFSGTSDKEIMKAMNSYLNQTGAGDYNLPNLIGDRVSDSTKKNNPNWSLYSRTQLSWFPDRHVDFVGKTSPAVTSYKPAEDNTKFANVKFSVGKHQRFYLPSSITRIQKQVPVQYMEKEPGQNYQFNKVSIGVGEKSDFLGIKKSKLLPGPDHYERHVKDSISYQSLKKNPKTPHGFYNNYDKYDKICYKGMEQHFYGRESQGPGYYLSQDYVSQSLSKKSQ